MHPWLGKFKWAVECSRCVAKFPALVSIAGLCVALGTPARADVTYHYDSPINYWADSGGRGSFGLYAGLDSHITLDFTLASPLGANLGVPVGPSWHTIDAGDILSWSYHGGSPFLNIGSSVAGSTFTIGVVTDALGRIANAGFSVSGPVSIANLPVPDALGQTQYSSWLSNSHGAYYDQQLLTSTFTRVAGLYWKDYSPIYGTLSELVMTPQYGGTWTVTQNLTSPSAVPEPETYALMLGGLVLLGWRVKRRQRADRA